MRALSKLRSVLATGLLIVSCAAVGAASPAPRDGVSVTLLGTGGGPGGRVDRAGIATLIQAGERRYLIDAGAGLDRQLVRSGLGERDIPIVFLTHLHDDHTAGLPALATFAFTMRSPRLEILGPVGTSDYARALVALLDVSAQIRMAEGRFPGPTAAFIVAKEYEEGIVYRDDTVTVRAVENTHFQLAAGTPAARNKSYSLRFEIGRKSIVLTGDTGVSDAVEKLARGADILVAEMASAADIRSVPPMVRKHMELEHLSPTQVGELAAKSGVKTLILSHVGVVTPGEVAAVRRVFRGRVILGRDLAKIAL